MASPAGPQLGLQVPEPQRYPCSFLEERLREPSARRIPPLQDLPAPKPPDLFPPSRIDLAAARKWSQTIQDDFLGGNLPATKVRRLDVPGGFRAVKQTARTAKLCTVLAETGQERHRFAPEDWLNQKPVFAQREKARADEKYNTGAVRHMLFFSAKQRRWQIYGADASGQAIPPAKYLAPPSDFAAVEEEAPAGVWEGRGDNPPLTVHKVLECPQNEILALQAINQFRHPLLLEFVEAWQDQVSRYIVTEHCPDQDALNYLFLRRDSDVRDALFQRFGLHLSDAVQFLHGKGIAHRDISADNALVARGPDGVTLKLMDFAQAVRVFAGGGSLEHERKVPHAPGQMSPGKPNYAPPEIFDKREEHVRDGYLATALDVFQCGVTLFVMRCGVYLIHEPGDRHLVFPKDWWKLTRLPGNVLPEAVTRARARPWSQNVRDLPAEGVLKDLLERMLAANPGGRPRSRAVLEELATAWPMDGERYVPKLPLNGAVARCVSVDMNCLQRCSSVESVDMR